jgi:choice-of-anchor B domain-containing protein
MKEKSFSMKSDKRICSNSGTSRIMIRQKVELIAGLTLAIFFVTAVSVNSVPTIRKVPTDPAPTVLPLFPEGDQSPPAGFKTINTAPTVNAGENIYRFCLDTVFQFASVAGSDVWGYTSPDNIDYAIMGINAGIVFVNVNTRQIVDTVAGPGCSWQDIKTFGSYCYGVTECGSSIQVIDLQFLPDSVSLVNTVPVSPASAGVTISSSHNLNIDTVNGYLYAEGFGASGWTNRNVLVHSLANPATPVYITGFGSITQSVHDVYAHNDTVFVADGAVKSYSVWDLTDKNSPQLLSTWIPPGGGYAHNIWPNSDNTVAVTTEETPFKTVKFWGIQDLGNVQLLGEYLAPSGLAHNAQVKGDTVYIAHYESGMRVVDFSDPTNPVEIGSLDTWPTEFAGFNGCWGMYPYSPNGFIYGSNMDGRLFIVREETVGAFDTLIVENVSAPAGSQVQVDIYGANSHPIHRFQIPIFYDGPANLTLDSVSKVGLRSETMEKIDTLSVNPITRELALALIASTTDVNAALDAGSGPILSLFFTVPGGAADGPNAINIQDVNGVVQSYSDPCALVVTPAVTAGSIEVTPPGCCLIPGDANFDFVTNIADVTFEIARIFSGGPAPVCTDQADANGDNTFNIADVTYLIARIFSGGPAPICGTTGS